MGGFITVFRLLLLYLIIVLGSIFISYKTKKKFEKSIAPFLAILILVLYLFGIFELLIYGVWVVSILSIVLGIYALIKDNNNIKERILTPGFTFFSLAFFILMIFTYNKNLVDYDHYLYRSYNTKIMFYTDTISKGFQALYPPSINLLEYFFMKVIGVYMQGIEAISVQLFGFALMLPLFDRKNNNRFINLIITAIVICMPTILANLIFYEAAYPDCLLGLFVGYSVYMLYTEESNRFKLFAVGLICAVMTITKPAGLYLSAIVIGVYALANLLNYNAKKLGEKIKAFLKSKEFKNICIITITILVIFASWKIFTRINNRYNDYIIRQNPSRLNGNPIEYTIKTTLTTLFGLYGGENHEAADSNQLLTSRIYSYYAMMAPVRVTLFGAMAFILVSGILVYRFVVKKENKKEFSNYLIALTVGLVVYILFLQLSYILKFSTDEMLEHAGLNRYLPTFLLGMIYFIVGMALINMEETKVSKSVYVILVAIIISCSYLPPIMDATLTSGAFNIYSYEYTNNGRVYANKLKEKIEKDEKIILLSQQEDTNLYNLMVRYYLYPHSKAYTYNELNEAGINSLKNTIIKENIKYIFIYSSNDATEEIFNNSAELKNTTLYRINVLNEDILLKEIPMD